MIADQTGKTVKDSDFRGRFMLVYFGYTLCPDVCPTTLGSVADALAKLAGQRSHLVPLFITLDPERDKPAALKTYLSAFGPEFVGLTGSTAEITKVAHGYRVWFRRHPLGHGGYALDHTSALYLMGRDGKFVTYYDDATDPEALARDLRKRI